jgi:hypothetical protein
MSVVVVLVPFDGFPREKTSEAGDPVDPRDGRPTVLLYVPLWVAD